MTLFEDRDRDSGWESSRRRSALPADFDSMAPNPFLATIVMYTDRSTLDEYDLVRLLRAEDRLVSHFQARRASSMVAVAEASGWDEQVSLEIATALHLTTRSGDIELGLAASIEAFPEVHSRLLTGELDLRRARAAVEAVEHLDVEAARDILAEVADRLPDRTTGEIRALIRRTCLTHDPADATRRLEDAVSNRRVDVYPTGDGTANIVFGDLPPDRAAAAMANIESLARQLPGDDRTAEQRRVDVALDLLCGHGAPAGRGTVDLTVDLTTLLALDERPGELGGWGPVVAEVARSVAAAQRDVSWQATVTLADGSLHTTALRRRPSAEQARAVVAKLPRCVFPGCRHPARTGDLDHTVDFQFGGPTSTANLAPLCRRHHRAKHTAGWSYRVDNDSVHWTSPAGHRYVTAPRGP